MQSPKYVKSLSKISDDLRFGIFGGISSMHHFLIQSPLIISPGYFQSCDGDTLLIFPRWFLLRKWQTVDFSMFFLKQSYCLLGRTPCVFPSKSNSGAQHTHPELQSCCAGKISQETWMVKWKKSCRISTKSDVSNRAGGRPTEWCSGQREVSRRLAKSLRFSRSNPNICLVLVLLGRRMQW